MLRAAAAGREDRGTGMLKRQRFLLALIDRADAAATRAWLQEAAFLVSRDRAAWTSSPLHDFVPHRAGPHSFSLDRELDALVRDGFADEDGGRLTVTATGRAESATIDPAHAFALRAAWHRDRLADAAGLAARIDTAFLWFTVNADDPARRREERPKAACALYTAGYRGTSIDGFLDGLLRRGVERIVDVRANPASRRLGFHKSTLKKLAAEVGIAYEHFPQLGVAKELRAEALSKDEINRMFEDYAVRIRGQDADLAAVLALLAERPSVLVCAETHAADCHRSRLTSALAERSPLPVEHLDLRTDSSEDDEA
jgi:hypothetical protein